MKKYLLLLFLFSGVRIFAQPAATYIFSTNSITPLEVLNAPTTIIASGVDDQASPLFPIGFTFSFTGISYTQMSVSSNGLSCLGSGTVATFSNLFPGNAGTMPVLMPMWDDLYTEGLGVRYQTLGVAPNRKLVVDFEVRSFGGGVAGIADKKFQIWLSETSNVITFVYDFGTVLSSSTVGIGASAADYQSVTTSNHTSSTVAVNNANTSWPGAQRAYIFSPPLPCGGVPTAGTTACNPNPPCPNTNFTCSLVGATVAVGLTYQWISSPSGNPGTWAIIGGATNSIYSTALPAGQTIFYRCIVTCTNPGGGFDTSVAVQVNVQNWSPTSNCWCVPTYATGGANDNISNVVLGTLSNNTAAAGNPSPFWVNYTPQQVANTLSTPVLYIGLPANLAVTYGADANQYGAVWIDFDHNGTFDPTEYFSNGTNAGANGTHNISVTPPGATVPGITRMRIRGGDNAQMLNTQPCGPTNSVNGESEDYLVNIFPASPEDPAVTAINGAPGNCFTASQTMVVSLTNYGSNAINLAVNPVALLLHVTGPLGLTTYTVNVTSGTLNSLGANTIPVIFSGVNMYNGGTYYLNTSLTIGNAGGVVNGNLINDSLANAIVRQNYRPTAGPDFQLCQYSNILFGQGLTVSGCATVLYDSLTLNFTITGPCTDNTGATQTGTGTGPNNANCADIYACAFGNVVVPALPAGASFTAPGVLTVTNLATIGASFASEVRMNLYGPNLNPANIYSPGLQGAAGGQNPNFNYQRNIAQNQLSAIFSALSPGGQLNLGYWESYNDIVAGTDININAGGGTTTASLKIYYQYVPSAFEWYNVPAGGASLYSLSPFNPITTPGSGITNSNTPGTYPFYAACIGSSNCRVPVNLVINPTPLAYQDTLAQCENPPGSNGSIFDLTTMDGPVSGFVPGTTVEYFADQGLFIPIPYPTADTTGTTFVFAKVSYLTGCSSSDSLMLQVNGQPEFPAAILTGNACAPASIDVATLIDPLTTVPAGSDTLYFSDAACTIPHPNPHNVTVTDTVYIVIATNTVPVCADTAVAYIELSTAGNLIANQDILNFSIPGFVGCNTFTLTDGNTDTLYNPQDCKRIVHITDLPNATDLGSTQVCEWIDASTQYHNGQPYVNRHYQITPSAQTSAQVCLYFLEDDFAIYNADAIFNGWPQINPNVNLCISQVDNGDIIDPGHTAISIPNAAISATYDPGTTVWTVCFPVDSFSYFYCHTCNPMNTPLPVNLLSFTGKKVDYTSLLQWVTASEQNNSHFILEHSRDGKTFSPLSDIIPSIAPNGNSNVKLNYSYTDYTPYSGYNYYRLQQIDLDQKVSYSQIVKVYHGDETVVNLFPNPVSSQLNIEINSPKATLAQIKIVDATGRVVRMVDMQLQAGNNVGEIGMDGLADGVYLIKITNNKGLNYSQSIRKN